MRGTRVVRQITSTFITMIFSHRSFFLLIAGVSAACAFGFGAPIQPPLPTPAPLPVYPKIYYQIVDLGLPPGPSYGAYESGGTAINDAGDVAGYVFNGDIEICARFPASGSPSIYPSLIPTSDATSAASGINKSGTIVGMMAGLLPDGRPLGIDAQAVTSSGMVVDGGLGLLGQSEFVKINDAGEALGRVGYPTPLNSFISDIAGTSRFYLAGILGTDFIPTDINNVHELVGNNRLGGLIYHRDTNSVEYLASALADPANHAQAINDLLQVGGVSAGRGYIYDHGRVAFFGSGIFNVAHINNNGIAVGNRIGGSPFFYNIHSGVLTDLWSLSYTASSAGWTVVDVTGINYYGVMCGIGRRLPAFGEPHNADGYVYHAIKIVQISTFTIYPGL